MALECEGRHYTIPGEVCGEAADTWLRIGDYPQWPACPKHLLYHHHLMQVAYEDVEKILHHRKKRGA